MNEIKKEILPIRVFRFYYDGFKAMEWGRQLWILILIKLFVIFVVLRIFFFPRFLNRFDTVSAKEEYISNELVERIITP